MTQYDNTNAFADGVQATAALSAANGRQYDAVSAVAGGMLAGSATAPLHSHNVMSVTTSTTSSANTAGWNNTTITGAPTQLYYQGYYYFTANPVANTNIVRFTTGGTTNACATVVALTSGLLRVTDAAVATVSTLTTAIPLNTWFRINFRCLGGTTTGQVELKLFADDTTTPLDSFTSAATLNTNAAGTGIVDTVRFGNTGPLALAQTFYIGDVSINDTTFPAPSYIAPVSGWQFSKNVRFG